MSSVHHQVLAALLVALFGSGCAQQQSTTAYTQAGHEDLPVLNKMISTLDDKCQKESDHAACMEGARLASAHTEQRLNFLSKACFLNDGESCGLAAYTAHSLGKNAESEYLDIKGCELNNALSCLSAGLNSIETAPDHAQYYIEKGCSLDPGNSQCAELTALVNKELNSDNALKKARRLCEQGKGSYCSFLAFHNMSVYNPKLADYAQAEKYAKKGCSLNDGFACFYLGTLYSETRSSKGYTLPEDQYQSYQYNLKACRLKNPAGCHDLGVKYLQGKGVRQDEGKALEAFGKSCDLGNNSGCAEYKHLKLIMRR
ncbi:MAG: sel1 repeat family protein [Succinivibrio sp.]|nr:sel1 repeat family protein [Succinivibrio sp.]